MAYRMTFMTVIVLTIILLPSFVMAAGLSDSLVGYWPLDGNGKDESGNGNDATLEAGAKWVTNGWINGAMEVDGNGGHAVVDSAFELVTTEITVTARINGWRTIPWSGVVVGRSDTTFWMGIADNEIPHVEQTVVNLKFGWDDCCGARYFKGIIDEVMIFDRTLSADEITQLAVGGLPVESRGKLTTTWAALK